ncbi:uncharacterized protein [Centruroides vittatus]|uniref:uncharacterized protein n=1 Tax=Centruroides vittatus TaxID=120091 RepID=UPI00350F3C5F
MSDIDINSEEFWAGCTSQTFFQLLEHDYTELGLDSRIDRGFKLAVKLGLQHTVDICSKCSKPCKVVYRNDRKSCAMRCHKCWNFSSAFDGTFKGKCGNLPWNSILSFIWHHLALDCSTNISANAAGISNKAAVDWSNHIRFVMLVALHNILSFKIGGPNKTVEIDETVICKRKYEKGRKLKSTKWVVGGICREDKSCFVCQVNDRSENTLNWIISKFINSGTTVLTDEWKGYYNIDKLEGIEISHRTVNHSENFVDPKTGVHTQNIERLWGYLKNKKKPSKTLYRRPFRFLHVQYAFMYRKYLNWPSKKLGDRFFYLRSTFTEYISRTWKGTNMEGTRDSPSSPYSGKTFGKKGMRGGN